MTQHISIGRFSVLSGLSIRALRLYDKLDILKPAAVAKHNQYRYYLPEQLELAKQIKAYRNLELPLEQIKLICREPQVAQFILTQHLELLQKTVLSYQEMTQELTQMLYQLM